MTADVGPWVIGVPRWWSYAEGHTVAAATASATGFNKLGMAR